jgi:hypothetical protein
LRLCNYGEDCKLFGAHRTCPYRHETCKHFVCVGLFCLFLLVVCVCPRVLCLRFVLRLVFCVCVFVRCYYLNLE